MKEKCTPRRKRRPPLLFPSKYVVLDNKELGILEDALNLTCDLHLCCNDNTVSAARDVQYSHEIPHPLFPYVSYACHVTLTTSYPSLSCFISAVTVWDWLRTCLVVMATSQQGHSHSSITLCQNLKCRDASYVTHLRSHLSRGVATTLVSATHFLACPVPLKARSPFCY